MLRPVAPETKKMIFAIHYMLTRKRWVMLKRKKSDIYQNFRRKVLDVEEKKMMEMVEQGQETAYKFTSKSNIEGEFRAKTNPFYSALRKWSSE